MNLRTVWLKLRALLARPRVEGELDEEIRFHLEMETEENRRRGMTADEARRKAYSRFGGVERHKEGAREARGTLWLEDSLRDVRHGFRSMGRSPGFAAAALFTLALGVGGTTAVFSVVRGVLLRPLPFAEPAGLLSVWLSNPPQGIDEDVTSWPSFEAWRAQTRTLSHVVGVSPFTMSLTGDGEPEEVRAARVTRGFFEMLGVPLALGRDFRPEEVELDEESRIVVLSHQLWTRRFSADPALVGRSIRLNDVSYEVVGVAAPGAGYPFDVQLWTPLTFTGGRAGLREAAGALWLPVKGRLAPGVTPVQAQTDMSGVADRLAQADSASNFGTSIKLEALHETEVGEVRVALLTLLGAVILVMLIAVANVANLLLARGTARAREMAVRLSLGAGRPRLTRQLLTESAVLGLTGAALGALVAFLGVRLLLRFNPPDLPRLDGVRVDLSVLAFALVLAVGASLLFGLIPALHAGRGGQTDELRRGGRGASEGGLGRTRAVFVSAQFAFALVLLVGSGLLTRSFVNLLSVDPGFEPHGVLTFRVNLPPARYASAEDIQVFNDRLISTLEAVPGVERAAFVTQFMMSRLPNMSGIAVESRPGLDTREHPVPYDGVTTDFLDVLGMRLLSGRAFGPEDVAEAPQVAVVSEAFVRTFLPDRDPIGERFTFGSPDGDDAQWITVVGVVQDAKRAGLHEPVRPYVFLPMPQFVGRAADVMIRTDGDPVALISSVRAEMRRLDPSLPLSNLRTLDQALSSTLASRRFLMMLVGVFAGAATLLAAVGIYGVMAYMVSRRTREIGIRVALGASRSLVIGSVLRQSFLNVAAGVVLGLIGALLVTRFLQSELYGLEATDPSTFATMTGLLVLVAAAASWIPARRAARVEPSVALREE